MSELTHDDVSAILQEHGQDIQRFLTRRLGCADTAADLLQETFLCLIQSKQA